MKKFRLRFSTAFVYFNNEAQMRLFLESHCYKSGKRIYLHHGVNLHYFDELGTECYKFIPSGLNMRAKRTEFYHTQNFIFNDIQLCNREQ